MLGRKDCYERQPKMRESVVKEQIWERNTYEIYE